MLTKPLALRAAADFWVAQFNEINRDMIVRLMKYEPDTWREVTVPVEGNRAYAYTADDYGVIVEYDTQSGDYRIKTDSGAFIYARAEDFEVEYDDALRLSYLRTR